MSKYQKEFTSMDGKVFSADVYSVLAAFGVECPARQHAIKKLLMAGQRGSKGEVQDLDEALASVSRAVDMAYAKRDSHGTSGEAEPEPIAEAEPEPEPAAEPEPEPKPKLVTWRLCVRIDEPTGLDDGAVWIKWYPSGDIPEHWYPIESYEQPIETVQQLPKGEKP